LREKQHENGKAWICWPTATPEGFSPGPDSDEWDEIQEQILEERLFDIVYPEDDESEC
jgi:hypothetical protein